MEVNSLITWAVIDPVMRAVITETRVSSLRLVAKVMLEESELPILL